MGVFSESAAQPVDSTTSDTSPRPNSLATRRSEAQGGSLQGRQRRRDGWRYDDDTMLQVGLDETAQKLTLAIFRPAQEAWARMELLANDVDETLEKFGMFRAAMKPPVPDAPDRVVALLENPTFNIDVDPSRGGVTMFIRHIGFGWMAFNFPQGECSKFVDILSKGVSQQKVQDHSDSNVVSIKK
jgi:hypothetical protein